MNNHEHISTEETRKWVALIEEGLSGSSASLARLIEVTTDFDKYNREVVTPITGSSIKAVFETAVNGDRERFAAILSGLTRVAFIAGYIEGTSKQEEIGKLNKLLD